MLLASFLCQKNWILPTSCHGCHPTLQCSPNDLCHAYPHCIPPPMQMLKYHRLYNKSTSPRRYPSQHVSPCPSSQGASAPFELLSARSLPAYSAHWHLSNGSPPYCVLPLPDPSSRLLLYMHNTDNRFPPLRHTSLPAVPQPSDNCLLRTRDTDCLYYLFHPQALRSFYEKNTKDAARSSPRFRHLPARSSPYSSLQKLSPHAPSKSPIVPGSSHQEALPAHAYRMHPEGHSLLLHVQPLLPPNKGIPLLPHFRPHLPMPLPGNHNRKLLLFSPVCRLEPASLPHSL